MRHVTRQELEAGLDEIRRSPKGEGRLHRIVRRPRKFAREVLEQGELDLALGLVGDNWSQHRSSMTADGTPDADTQLTIMNSRTIALIAQEKDRWALAGDQLYVELDLSGENLPPGSQLAIGEAIVEVTGEPHTGCRQFVDRFGLDAMKFVNSAVGRRLNLRGINTKIVKPGLIREGDIVRKIL